MISGKVVLGALAGVAAGALIGVLFAPDKGSDSRSKIVKKGDEYLDSVKVNSTHFLTVCPENTTEGKLISLMLTIQDIKRQKETCNPLQDEIPGRLS